MDWSKIWSPFKTLLQDRVVVTAILSTIGAAVVNLIPAIQPYMSLVIPALIAVVLMAAGSSAVTAPFRVMAAARVEAAKAQAAHG